MDILYEDKYIVVCVKDPGVLSEAGGMPELLKESTGAKDIFCVHRLDKAVGGVMVYAKTASAAAGLSDAIAKKSFAKEYVAVVQGQPEECGTMRDLLFHDVRKNKTYIVDRERKGVKEAVLDYRKLGFVDSLSLVYIILRTGRSHQIRVQFASRKMPLAGDGKYGSSYKDMPLGLWAYSLTFPHPVTGKSMRFKKSPPCLPPWDKFDDIHLP